MTDAIARATGWDAANRQMEQAGRTKWNRADYQLAAETFNRLFPLQGIYRTSTKVAK
jgi:hypothetical protein